MERSFSQSAPDGLWVRQAIGLLDALGIDKAHVVGNSGGRSR